MKSIKEKQMFVKWAKAMNQPVDTALVEEVEKYEKIQNEIVESIRENSIRDLVEAAQVAEKLIEKVQIEFPKPPTLEEVLSVIKEETNELVQSQTEQAIETSQSISAESAPETLVDIVASHITKEVKLEEKADSFQQPDPALVSKNLDAITKKLKFLEQAIGKIAAHGPGGGAGDVISLDHPVKLITSDYTISRKDYYIGVNAATSVNITLLNSIGFPGRMVIIKDESGNCSNNPIVVAGTVDNDTGGFILAQDNGGIQMIYREGWRIV